MFLITNLLRFSVRHPRVVIALAGAITVCALVFIPRIQLRLDGRSLIPSGLPQFAEGDRAASRFELRDLVLIGVGNEESGVYTPETLRRIARLSDGLSRVKGVVPDSVASISTVPRLTLVDGKVWIGGDLMIATASGTSMASPHVAGVVALYLQNHRTASPAAVRSALVGNSTEGVISNAGVSQPVIVYELLIDQAAIACIDSRPSTQLQVAVSPFGGNMW